MEQVINPVKRVNQKPYSRIELMNALDRTNWTPVTFGEVCRNLNETEKDLLGNGIERYVGLEHIEPNSLHIKSWGNVADGTTFTKKFNAGHVLFGKRRAYLRKAAIPDFDGVCSGDILVFEANEEIIDSNLFPFLVQSDRFFDFAIQTSSGSLSPRTKFQDLAKLEFLLPPKEQQAELAELLWAADDVMQDYLNVVKALLQIKSNYSQLKYFNGKRVNRADDIQVPEGWQLVPVKDCVESIEYGISLSIPDNADVNGFPILSTAELNTDGTISYDEIRTIAYAKGLNDRLILRTGDIVFNWRNSPELIGKSAIFKQPSNKLKYTYASFLLRIRCDEIASHNEYLAQLFNYYRESGIFIGMARKAVNQANFNKQEVYELRIPLPSYVEQVKIAQQLRLLDMQMESFTSQYYQTRSIQMQITNQIFS